MPPRQNPIPQPQQEESGDVLSVQDETDSRLKKAETLQIKNEELKAAIDEIGLKPPFKLSGTVIFGKFSSGEYIAALNVKENRFVIAGPDGSKAFYDSAEEVIVILNNITSPTKKTPEQNDYIQAKNKETGESMKDLGLNFDFDGVIVKIDINKEVDEIITHSQEDENRYLAGFNQKMRKFVIVHEEEGNREKTYFDSAKEMMMNLKDVYMKAVTLDIKYFTSVDPNLSPMERANFDESDSAIARVARGIKNAQRNGINNSELMALIEPHLPSLKNRAENAKQSLKNKISHLSSYPNKVRQIKELQSRMITLEEARKFLFQ